MSLGGTRFTYYGNSRTSVRRVRIRKGEPVKHLWKNYSLSIVLAALFLSSWVMQTWMGWQEFISEQQSHGQAAQVFGLEDYIWR